MSESAVLVGIICIHCKYLQPVNSYWLYYMCHCNLAVIITDNDSLCTFTDIEEYNLRSVAILGCNIYSQITVAHVTLPKAVMSAVKIFAVWV